MLLGVKDLSEDAVMKQAWRLEPFTSERTPHCGIRCLLRDRSRDPMRREEIGNLRGIGCFTQMKSQRVCQGETLALAWPTVIEEIIQAHCISLCLGLFQTMYKSSNMYSRWKISNLS